MVPDELGYFTSLTGRNNSELTNDAGFATGAYSPANPGHWAGTPPATVAVSNNGATPV